MIRVLSGVMSLEDPESNIQSVDASPAPSAIDTDSSTLSSSDAFSFATQTWSSPKVELDSLERSFCTVG